MTGMREGVELVRKLKQRTILPVWDKAAYRFQVVLVDDQGSCSVKQHPAMEGGFVQPNLWHRYQNERGAFFAVRCPASLSEEERGRTLVDIPPGSAARSLAMRALERKSTKKREPSASEDRFRRGAETGE